VVEQAPAAGLDLAHGRGVGGHGCRRGPRRGPGRALQYTLDRRPRLASLILSSRLRGWDVTDRLPEISAPALVTGGRYDEARPAHVAMLADRIPHAELMIFENSAHMAFVEERERYIAVADDFLTRTEAAA
jgi:pimeloyl-ACP methyl ester carboxylesterase